MRNLIRRITSKLSPHESQGDRSGGPSRGAIVQMLVCDISNIDRLTSALAEHRR